MIRASRSSLRWRAVLSGFPVGDVEQCPLDEARLRVDPAGDAHPAFLAVPPPDPGLNVAHLPVPAHPVENPPTGLRDDVLSSGAKLGLKGLDVLVAGDPGAEEVGLDDPAVLDPAPEKPHLSVVVEVLEAPLAFGQSRFGPLPLGQLLAEGGVELSVVVGDGGQLPEPGHEVGGFGVERSRVDEPGHADDPGHPAVGLDGHGDDGVEVVVLGHRRPPRPGAVIVDRQGLAGLPDLAGQPLARSQAEPHEPGPVGPGAEPDHQLVGFRVVEVDKSVGGVHQVGGVPADPVQKVIQLVAPHDPQSRLVEGGEAGLPTPEGRRNLPLVADVIHDGQTDGRLVVIIPGQSASGDVGPADGPVAGHQPKRPAQG